MTSTEVATAEPTPSGRYCFGTGPGARAPLPAAKIKAAVLTGALDNARHSIHSFAAHTRQRVNPGFALAKPGRAG